VRETLLGFAHIENGRETWGACSSVPRHRHDQAYAALVLAGSYEESGSRGRLRVGPGDVLLHRRFDAHRDRFGERGAQIVNILLCGTEVSAFAVGRVRDADTIARTAESDPLQAGLEMKAQLNEACRGAGDWPDALARDLLDDPDIRLADWAGRHDLAAETVSRGFSKVFGLTPAAFRTESRAHRAFVLIAGTSIPLAWVAAETGFSDQAHMSRAVAGLTGAPPSHWRRSIPFKTGGQSSCQIAP